MRIESNGIIIYLEQNEIINLWNIIMFALDLQAQRDKEKIPCMNEAELKLAHKIEEILFPIK